MENTPAADIFETTRLLKAWSEGDETALERLVPLVDAESFSSSISVKDMVHR